MKVLSIKEYKRGGARITFDFTPEEYEILFTAGLKKIVEDMGSEVAVLTIAEAERLGINPKKSVEFSKKDCDECVKVAVYDALTLAIKSKWKPGKCKKK